MLKRFFTAILVLTMLLSCASPASAETGSAGTALTISLETIEQQWLERSPEYTKINYDLALAEEIYTDLYDSCDLMGDHLSAANFSTYQTLMNSRDKAKCALDIAKAQYDANVQNGILAAERAFLACWQDDLNVALAQQNLDIKNNQLLNNAVALQNGYISQETYDNLKSAVDGLQNSLSALSAKQASSRTALKLKLGIDFEREIVLSYPEFNKDFFEKLIVTDFESDLISVGENSVAIKSLQISYDSMTKYSYANYNQKKEASLSLNNAKIALEPNFVLMHRNLLNQYNDLLTAFSGFELEKDKLAKFKKQYEQGYVSSLVLSNIKLEYASMEASLAGKKAALYLTWLSYKNTVSGY
jgi:hypothetical protein